MAEIENGEKTKLTKKLVFRMCLAMAIIVAGLMTTMLFVVCGVLRNQVRASEYEFMDNIVAGRADEVVNYLEVYKNDMKVYSTADINATGDNAAVIEWLQNHQNLRNPAYDYMFFCDSEGTSVRDTGLVGTKGALTERDYYQAMMKQNMNEFVGDMVLSKTSGQYVIPIARAAKNANGKTFGFYVGMLGFKQLSDKITSFKIGKTGFFYVIDQKGTIISHPDEKLFSKTLDPKDPVMQAIKSRAGTAQVMENGKEIHKAISPVGDIGWYLILSIDEKEILKPVDHTRMFTIAFGVLIEILIFLVFVFFILRMVKRIKNIENLILGLSTGEADLTVQLETKSDDEIDALAKAVNKFLRKFREIMTTVKSSENNLEEAGTVLSQEISSTTATISQMSDSIKMVNGQVQTQAGVVENSSSAVEEISKNIESLDRMIQSQASCVVEASAAVEEMIGNISAVDKSVVKVSGEFSSLESDAKNGIEKNTAVNDLIQKIADQSSSMVDANSIIQSIAEQTNLLAMNAAIEAAHAGEAGKGFSVVADEIRKLAETSAEQSNKIGQELSSIQEGIVHVVAASSESEKSLQSVSNRINTTGQLITQIRSAMEEQQAGSQQILEALQAMNDSTSEVRGAAEEMNKGGEVIMRDVQNLKESMNNIQTAVSEITSGTDYVNDTTKKLKSISTSLTDSIDKIGKDVNLFKV